MVTNMILTDEIYVIMFRLYSELHEKEIMALKQIQDNELLLNTKLNLQSL